MDLRTLRGPERNWSRGQPTPPATYHARFLKRFWDKVNKDGPVLRADLGQCWVWTASLSAGYGQIAHRDHGTATQPMKAHAAAWTVVYGREVPDGHEVCHKCNNKACIREEHLFTGTHKTNMHHAQATGLMPIAAPKPERERHWNVVPTKRQRQLLREVREAKGVSFFWLCSVLEVDQSQFSRLETGNGSGGKSLRLEKTICLLRMLGIDEQTFLDEADLIYGNSERRIPPKYRQRLKEYVNRPVAWVADYDNSEFVALVTSLRQLGVPDVHLYRSFGAGSYYFHQLLNHKKVKPPILDRMRAFVATMKERFRAKAA